MPAPRELLEKALIEVDERIYRAYQVLKPIHKEGLLDRLEQSIQLSKQSAINMQAWLRAVKEPEKLSYRVEWMEPCYGRTDSGFKATCLDWEGHATYAPTQLEALEGCVQSVRLMAFRKIETILYWMEGNLPDKGSNMLGPMDYAVPKWRTK